jgi:hypothetical protein
MFNVQYYYYVVPQRVSCIRDMNGEQADAQLNTQSVISTTVVGIAFVWTLLWREGEREHEQLRTTYTVHQLL